MELIDILKVIRRWWWLIVGFAVITELALWLGMRSAEPTYTATVKLQISTPQREDVAAYDEYRSVSMRDEITVAINNLIDLLQNDEVHKRTANRLGLDGKDTSYTITAKRVTDADFIKVTIEARTPDLAAKIINEHIDVAITYYGELRAKSIRAEKELFAEQLRLAEEKLLAAENALADFRTRNRIYSLTSQTATQQRLLEQLQLERDKLLLEQAIKVADGIIPIVTPTINSVTEVDKLIAQRMKELDQYTALTPQYNILEQNVEQARTEHEHLLSKYGEAELKIVAVQAANFIQVIKPGEAPTESESSWPKLAVLILVGSLGLGVVTAFFLEYISSSTVMREGAPESKHSGQKFWERVRMLRPNNPLSKRTRLEPSTDVDIGQEPIDVEIQHTSSRNKVK